MPPHLAAARIDRQAFGREHILPYPIFPRIRILSFQGRPDVDSSRPLSQILPINGLHKDKMLFQGSGKTFREHGYPVLLPLSIPHHDLMRMFRLPDLPVRNPLAFSRVTQKGFNIISRPGFQSFFRQKNGQSLWPISHKMANDPAEPCSPSVQPGMLPRKHCSL